MKRCSMRLYDIDILINGVGRPRGYQFVVGDALAGRPECRRLSLRSGAKEIPAHLQMSEIRLWALYWVATAIRRECRSSTGVGEAQNRLMRDFSAEKDGRFWRRRSVNLHKATAAPASKHEGKSVSRKGLMLVWLASGPPLQRSIGLELFWLWAAPRRKESSLSRGDSLMHRGQPGQSDECTSQAFGL